MRSLVKIMKIGICGSDIHVYHGKHPFTKYPVTQGHEVSGGSRRSARTLTGLHVGQKVSRSSRRSRLRKCYPLPPWEAGQILCKS